MTASKKAKWESSEESRREAMRGDNGTKHQGPQRASH